MKRSDSTDFCWLLVIISAIYFFPSVSAQQAGLFYNRSKYSCIWAGPQMAYMQLGHYKISNETKRFSKGRLTMK